MNPASSHKPSPASASGTGEDGGGGGGGGGGLGEEGNKSQHQQQPQQQEQQQQKQQQKKKKEDSVAGVALSFPTVTGEDPGDLSSAGVDDPTSLLSALRDEHSNATVVSKTCLQICQFAGHGSQAVLQDDSTVLQAAPVFHDATYAKIVSNSIQALSECLKEHKDRRCRLLAAQTLGVLGKAAYARIRPSPSLYTARDGTVSRLEDEIGAELPTALITAALEEEDEGVSATALSALGLLVQFHSSGAANAYCHDELAFGLLSLTAPGTSPYAPRLSSLCDEDPGTAAAELAARVLENVVQPRLLSVLERVVRYVTTPGLSQALPTIAAALCHQLQTVAQVRFGMDRATFAKNWAEVDAIGLVNTVVESLIVPCLQQGLDGHVCQVAAMAALRLAHACSNTQAAWITGICRQVILVQQEALSATPLSVCHKLNLLATLVIAARPIPFPERTNTLLALVDPILALPSTTRAPMGVTSPGLVMNEYANRNHAQTILSNNLLYHQQVNFAKHYRRPARIAYWTELALHFFLDGPAPAEADLEQAQQPTPGSGNNNNANANNPNNGGGRQEALRKFLSMPTITSVIGDNPSANRSSSSPLNPRDELLLVFTGVAIACGRRFRGGTADPTAAGSTAPTGAAAASASSWPITDPSAQPVEEWLQLSWVVLTAFVPCVNSGRKYTYLEEDLSLQTAGLTQYVQLLQEYLHFAGLLHPGSSVALKLVANACPPHLLWDQLSESAAFLARFEALDMGLLENTTKLLNEIVAREVKQPPHGIPSHHMRLFLLALAADHWMQGRVAAIRKQFESGSSSSAGGSTPSLDVQSARDIIMSLSPRRILLKIFANHVPPVDADGKKKKDPIKRLALETVRVCVACIENTALIACDWRKRFANVGGGGNSSQEPKHIVSVAVGVLQGKVDESQQQSQQSNAAHLEMIKAIMAPVCDAAVGRIQSFYESDMGGQDSFPASELVMQNVKTKIKPLVSSSSRPPTVSKDDFARGYLMQLCRQLVLSRVEQAIQSLPPADAELSPARATNWLRLSVPPLSDSRDGRFLGMRGEIASNYGSAVRQASAGSDPVAMIVAYTPRRFPRHDGEEEYRVTALLRVYNTTAFEFDNALRLELGLVNQGEFYFDGQLQHDMLEKDVRGSLDMDIGETVVAPLASASVVCKQELKPGEFLSWEVVLDHAGAGEGLALMPSVVFCNVPKEPAEVGAKWVGEKNVGGDTSTINTGGESGGEDDFQVTETENTMSGLKDGDTPSENVAISGDPLPLPPLIQLQPCPLIFLRDRWGDIDAFRFLWFRMPYHLPEVPLYEHEEGAPPPMQLPPANHMMRSVADMSSLVWNGEAIPGGYVSRAWAFSTLEGKRVLAVLSESDSDKRLALHLRGDDPYVLYGLVGPPRNRTQLAAALTPELIPVVE